MEAIFFSLQGILGLLGLWRQASSVIYYIQIFWPREKLPQPLPLLVKEEAKLSSDVLLPMSQNKNLAEIIKPTVTGM